MSATCDKHKPLERTQHCADCGSLMCVCCQEEHMLAYPAHKLRSITDILGDVVSCYRQLDCGEMCSQTDLIKQLQAKSEQAELFLKSMEKHLVSLVHTKIEKDLDDFRKLYFTAMQRLGEKHSLDPKILFAQVVDEYGKKDYAAIVQRLNCLPDLRSRFLHDRETVVGIKDQISAIKVQSYDVVREMVERGTQKMLQEVKVLCEGQCSICKCDSGNVVHACVNCRLPAEVCSSCTKECSQCRRKAFCSQCTYPCSGCRTIHCIGCTPARYQCKQCGKFTCGASSAGLRCCNRICVAANSQLCVFSSARQFSSNNVSHWTPENMLDPTVCYSFAFSGSRLGWVCWNMGGEAKRISRLVYVAQSGNTVAVEYSADGKAFTEATHFLDDKPFCDIRINVEGSYPYWRVRMVNSAGTSPYHHALWYY